MGAVHYRDFSVSRQTRYRVNSDGTIEELPGYSFGVTAEQQRSANYSNPIRAANETVKLFDSKAKDYPITSIAEANNLANKIVREQTEKLRQQYESELSKERQYSALS